MDGADPLFRDGMGAARGAARRRAVDAGRQLGRHVDRGMIGLWTIGEPHVATAFGSCMYYEEVSTPDPPPEVAFMPGCPTSDVKNPHVSEIVGIERYL